MRSLGSEQWVTDAQKAQDIVAKAVAKYTYAESSFDGLKTKLCFKKAWHGSPHDHDRFDSSKSVLVRALRLMGMGIISLIQRAWLNITGKNYQIILTGHQEGF